MSHVSTSLVPPVIGVRTATFASADGQRFRTGLRLVARWDMSQAHRELCLATATLEAAQAAGCAVTAPHLIVTCTEDYDELIIDVRHPAILVAGSRTRGARGHGRTTRLAY